jgi:hypothetical protein
MSEAPIYMDKEERITRVLAEVGENAALQNPGAVYPALQAPDPEAGRFRKLYFAPFEMKSRGWIDVNGDMPEFDAEKGWFNVGSAPELHINGRLQRDVPEIIRITHGLCCSMRAAEVMMRQPYALVGVNRTMDIVNWAQVAISLSYLDFIKRWLASVKSRYGVKADVDPSVHVVCSIGHMFSIELIEEFIASGVRGAEFVNEANLESTHKL